MNSSELYSAIFKRKSVRKFKNQKLEASKLQSIQDFIDELTPFYAGIKTEIAILSENEIKTMLPLKASHYVAVYSEAKEGYLVNSGFMLQQVDLFLSANGIGACWLGLGSPQKAAASRNGLDYVITLAIGYAEEPLHRTDISEFKRNPISEISSLIGAEELLEAARLAPSASNTQPWYFSGSTDKIVVSRKLPNMLKAALYGKYNLIDIGIVLCHLWIAALFAGKDIEFIKENVTLSKGYEYVTTVKIQ
ncbi:MAG: nitroreductase family protein [Pseudomonadota bacterium]